MPVGMATWLLYGQPLTDLAQRLADMGFRSLSFAAPQLPNLRQQMDELTRIAKDWGLATTFHLSIPEGAQSEALAHVWRDLSVVEELMAAGARVNAVTFDPAVWRSQRGATRGFAGEKTALALRAAWQRLGAAGVKIGLENWPSITTDIGSWDFVAMVAPEVEFGILLDIGHLNISYRQGHLGLLDPATYVATCQRSVVEVHVHDNDGQRDSHLFPGDGNTSFGPVFAALVRTGFQGVVTLEAAPNCQPLDACSDRTWQELRTAYDWLEARLRAAGIE
ncbi:MAG: sugar phosphate isomerase/epimerase [Armatimonadetes bacterium]|nr:sugar phosphate isomerase/epimerase [Armatimonadota bacterium]